MSINVGDLVATLTLQTEKFANGGKAAEQTVKKLEQMMNSAEKSTKKLNDTLARLGAETKLEVLTKRMADFFKAGDLQTWTQQHTVALSSFSKSLQTVSTVADGAGISTSGLTRVVSALSSPLGLATLAVGGFVAGMAAMATAIKLGTDAIVENAKEVNALMAVSGLGAEQADNLGDTMKLLGVNANAVTMAMFRLGNEIDMGGANLRQLGISVTDSSGKLKTEGELFLEIRDRISQMGSAGARSAALIDQFGRAGRELAPIFALNRDKFKEYMDEASKLSPWSEEAQRKTQDLIIEQNKLGMQWEALKEHIGSAVRGPLTEFLRMINAAADRMTEMRLPIARELPGEHRSGGIVLAPGERPPLSAQIPGEFGEVPLGERLGPPTPPSLRADEIALLKLQIQSRLDAKLNALKIEEAATRAAYATQTMSEEIFTEKSIEFTQRR